MKRKHSRRNPRKVYTKGELNRIVDSLLHPFFDSNPTLIPIDALLHGLIEQNMSESTIKFIRYTLPKIVKKATSDKH
jgi:hypothetical protein